MSGRIVVYASTQLADLFEGFGEKAKSTLNKITHILDSAEGIMVCTQNGTRNIAADMHSNSDVEAGGFTEAMIFTGKDWIRRMFNHIATKVVEPIKSKTGPLVEAMANKTADAVGRNLNPKALAPLFGAQAEPVRALAPAVAKVDNQRPWAWLYRRAREKDQFGLHLD